MKTEVDAVSLSRKAVTFLDTVVKTHDSFTKSCIARIIANNIYILYFRLKPRVRHDRRKPGHRNWLQGATDSAPANERNRHWLLPVTDPAPVTDSLHLKRSQFNDLWIRLDSAK